MPYAKTVDIKAKPPVAVACKASQMLRDILTKNPETQDFSIQLILETIGDRSAENSLIALSVQSVVPVRNGSDFAGIPAALIAGQMIAGRKQIVLPKAILDRSVSRRSLAVAVHAVLPILERAEKAIRARWLWLSHPIARRFLGVLIFLLALTIAFPFIGMDMAHATSMLVISLGLNERDGLAILIGVAAAVASLVIVIGVRFSASRLVSEGTAWLKRAALVLGRTGLAAVLKRFGFRWAHLVAITWQDLLLLWNPEQPIILRRDVVAAAAVKSRVIARLQRTKASKFASMRRVCFTQ